jgi:hypothetical protein
LKCHLRSSEDIKFIYLPEAKLCLANLIVEFKMYELNIYAKFILSNGSNTVCHNIQSLYIEFGSHISNRLADLISLQNNLKLQYLNI